MRIGDLLEALGFSCLVAAAYGYLGWRLAAVTAGLSLLYFGQCFAHQSLPKPKLRLPRLLKRRGGDE